MNDIQNSSNRLASLDVLRGLDLFFLVGLEEVMHPLAHAIDTPGFGSFMWNFTHVQWEGFSPWDLVMPLFLFMSGVAVPFALQRYRGGAYSGTLCRRLAKRVASLWLFGMMCQGNLFALDPSRVYLFSNTLQSIAVGYLFTALLFIRTQWKTQLATFAGLLIVYWGAMQFITVDGFGGGNYTPEGNLAEWIDRTVLGRFRDGASMGSGGVEFAPWYRYTWLLSSLGFVATVLSGALCGTLLRSTRFAPKRKALILLGAGAAMVAAGWLWNLQMPVIKKIWTSSMVLVSSGYCTLLLGALYWLIDIKGCRCGTDWLKVYGTNSIAAYMMANCLNLRAPLHSVCYGLEQYLGQTWYAVFLSAAVSITLYIILRQMYRAKIFLKV